LTGESTLRTVEAPSPFRPTVQPLLDAYTSAWQRAFDFSGRSGRPEFWWFFLANFIVIFLLNLVGSLNDFLQGVAGIYGIAQILPNLAVTIRRLRDAGRAWVWIFIGLIPIIGTIWLIVLLVQPSATPLA
jgi:uncharacterized membrane protein YhaH (DUF805 family)